MRKFLHAMLIVALFIATLGSGLKAEAASTTPTVSKISVTKVSNASTTAYVGGSDAEFTVKYDWTTPTTLYNADSPVVLKVTPANRGIANAGALTITGTTSAVKKGKTVYTTTATLVVKGVKNGKSTITLSAPFNKKSAKASVTVATLPDAISVADTTVEVAKGGTFNLAGKAVATDGVASNSAVSYTIKNVVDENDKDVTEAKKIAKLITVSKTGVITAKGICTADIVVASKAVTGLTETVSVSVTAADVTSIKLLDPTATRASKQEVASLKVNLFTNNGENKFDTLVKLNAGATYEDIKFTSSNTKVATVDKNGTITAVGNGKAAITVAPVLGNKVKATVNVTVTTKVDLLDVNTKLEILANKSKNSLGAKVNANASKQTITYKITSCAKADGTPVTKAKEIKKLITVSKTGVVSASKPCSAVIEVSAGTKNVDARVQYVDVTAVAPVTKISFVEPGNNKVNGKTAITEAAVVPSVYDDTSAAFARTYFQNLKVEGNPANDELVYTSSNEDVAFFAADHTVKLRCNAGKAVLSATAADGSGKKATLTITVKVAADTIIFPSSVVAVDAEDHDYEVEVEGGKNILPSAILNAHVNYNASTQGVKYSVTKKIKVDAGKAKDVKVTSKDGKTSKVVRIKGLAAEEIATKDDYELVLNSAYLLIAGTPFQYTVDFAPVAGTTKKVPAKAITWKSSDASIATISSTGLVTPKKSGYVTISATDGVYTETEYVFVARSDAEVKKELDAALTAGLKAENRDYLGAKVKFDSKKSLFTVDIIDPASAPARWENTGAIELFKTLPKSLETATIEVDGVSYFIERDGSTITIDGNSFDANTESEAAAEFVRTIIYGEAETLKDLNGRTVTIYTNSRDHFKYGDTEDFWFHFNEYTVQFSIADKTFESLVDADVNEAVEASSNFIKNDNTATISYDADKNVFRFSVVDETASIDDVIDDFAEYYLANDAYANNIDAVRADVDSVTVKAFNNGAQFYTITETPAEGKLTRDQINDYRTRISDKLFVGTESKTFASLENKTLSITTVYAVGSLKYTYTATVEFAIGKEAHEYRVDKKIVDTLASTTYEFGTVTYDKASKTFTIKAGGDQTFAAAYTSDLAALFNVLVGDSRVEKADAVSTKGVLSTVSGTGLTDDASIFKALTTGDASNKLSTVDGKSATVKVTYKNGASIIYTVKFVTPSQTQSSYDEADVSENDDTSDNDPAEDAEYDEAPAEDVSANVVTE